MTFHWWYNYRNHGCHLMCFSFRLWIFWPFGIWWISLVLHLPRSFHIQTPTYLTFCYRLEGVSCMKCFMGPHGFLATSCTLHFQVTSYSIINPQKIVITSKMCYIISVGQLHRLWIVSRSLLQVVYKLWNKHMNDYCINFVILQPIA